MLILSLKKYKIYLFVNKYKIYLFVNKYQSVLKNLPQVYLETQHTLSVREPPQYMALPTKDETSATTKKFANPKCL